MRARPGRREPSTATSPGPRVQPGDSVVHRGPYGSDLKQWLSEHCSARKIQLPGGTTSRLSRSWTPDARSASPEPRPLAAPSTGATISSAGGRHAGDRVDAYERLSPVVVHHRRPLRRQGPPRLQPASAWRQTSSPNGCGGRRAPRGGRPHDYFNSPLLRTCSNGVSQERRPRSRLPGPRDARRLRPVVPSWWAGCA